MEQFIDPALYITYVLIIFGAAAAVLLPFIQSLSNPKALAKTGIGIVALVVVFFIAYSISGAEVTPTYVERGVDANLSKTVGGMLTMMYILLFGAVIGIVVTEISKAVK
jgi:FtsH-binding integral membrane protein